MLVFAGDAKRAQEVIAPRAEEMDERGELPLDIVKQMGEIGLFGLPFPEEYGGQGSDFLTFCLAVEELARVDSSMAITLEAAVGLGAGPIHAFGTEEQKRRWLGPLCRGEMLGAFGLTEPGGGSDAGSTKTTARLEGGQWVIDGSKAFITNSGTAITGMVIVTAVTGLGTGLAQGCLEAAVAYASERRAFGRPIGAFQSIQFMIADIRVAVETARLATYRAAWLRDQGRPYKAEAAVAKLHASEVAVTAARQAVQVHGAYGYMEEFPVARFYRDAKVLEIGEGTNEIMRWIIARDLGLPESER